MIKGTEGTPYEGGYYHGKLKFPTEYPLRPPAVLMLTPSGRFKTNRRLCLSMSDFHPESWNPMWSVSTILTGLCVARHCLVLLQLFPGTASCSRINRLWGAWRRRTWVVVAPRRNDRRGQAQRRKLAAQSLTFNCADANFRELFGDLVELHEQRQRQAQVGIWISGASWQVPRRSTTPTSPSPPRYPTLLGTTVKPAHTRRAASRVRCSSWPASALPSPSSASSSSVVSHPSWRAV